MLHTARTEVFVSHRNAQQAVHGRRLLVQRVDAGPAVAHVAAQTGISGPTAHKRIYRSEDEVGRAGRFSRPHATSQRTPLDTRPGSASYDVTASGALEC